MSPGVQRTQARPGADRSVPTTWSTARVTTSQQPTGARFASRAGRGSRRAGRGRVRTDRDPGVALAGVAGPDGNQVRCVCRV